MIKRPLLSVVVALIIGELAALVGVDAKVAIIFIMGIIFLTMVVCYGLFLFDKNRFIYLIRRKLSVRHIVLILFFICMFAAGYVRCIQVGHIYDKYDAIQYNYYGNGQLLQGEAEYGANNEYHVCGVVGKIGKGDYQYNVEIEIGDGTIIVKTDNVESLQLGMTVDVYGQIKPMGRADNPGNYDEHEYMRGNGILLVVKASAQNITVISGHKEYSFVKQMLYEAKEKVYSILEKICTEKEMGLLSAMILGDKTYLDEDIKEQYSSQGIAHILAISGLHISVIGMGIYRLMRKKMRYLSSATISAIVMILFSIMTGNAISAVRAVIMFVLHVIADVLGRKYDLLSAASAAALILLWDNPYYLTNSSFLLSFAAMAAVGITGPVLVESIGTDNRFINTLTFNISVTFTTLPLMSNLFYRLPTYSIILNILVLPLMGILLLMAIIGVLTAVFLESIGTFFIGTTVYILRFYEHISAISSKLPYSSVITGNIEMKYVFLYYVLLALILLIMKRVRFRQLWKVLLCAMSFALMIFIVYGEKQNHFAMYFLDVGQGDGTYIRSETGNDYIIDCGSTDEKNIGQYKLESFLEYMDVDKVEYVFVSHCDTDHISGIKELLQREQILIDNIVLPETEVIGMSENAVKLVELAQDRGVNVMFFGAGDKLTDGALELYCVSPAAKLKYNDINEASMVLLMKYSDLNCVFTGDIGEETEMLIMDGIEEYYSSESGDRYMVLKVAHHGSRYSSCSEFLQVLRPDIAIISAGEGNRYGHPHVETLERLEEMGSEILTTLEYGAITVEVEEEIEIYGFTR